MPPSFLTYEEQHAGALQNLQQHQYQQKQKQSQAVEDVLPPKKRLKPTKSNVWSFFEKRCVGGQALAFCIVDGCPKKDGYKCGSTTSPMLKHMRDQHPTLWNAGPRAATVGTVGTLVAAPSGLVVKAVKWLVMSNMPLTTFDDKYWREMVCWMNSRASSITRAVSLSVSYSSRTPGATLIMESGLHVWRIVQLMRALLKRCTGSNSVRGQMLKTTLLRHDVGHSGAGTFVQVSFVARSRCDVPDDCGK